MFRRHEAHLQPPLLSTVNSLPQKQRQRLDASWAGVFYREFFCRLREEPFAALYSPKASRPNIPVNVLVGLEVLKAGWGWSDEEMYDAFTFDLQARYALGYHVLGDEQELVLRSVYNFRRRLTRYYLSTGIDLLSQAFRDITDQQIAALGVRTGRQRMDSTQVASNIRDMSRLQLAVELVQRVAGLLDEAQRSRYGESLALYLRGSSGQFVYRVKGREATFAKLQEVGELLLALQGEVAARHATHPTSLLLERFLNENYHLVSEALTPWPAPHPAEATGASDEERAGAAPSPTQGAAPAQGVGTGAATQVASPAVPVAADCPAAAEEPSPERASGLRVRTNGEISAGCLQSLHDPEATFRRKGTAEYKGYSANVTETCDPTNALQLITDVRVAPNTTNDAEFLVQTVPELGARMALETLHTDGGYASPEGDEVLRQHRVAQVPTAITGRRPKAGRLRLADYTITTDAEGVPREVGCPGGQRVLCRPTPRGGWVAPFTTAGCAGCPHAQEGSCRAKVRQRTGERRLCLNKAEAQRAQRRRRSEAQRHDSAQCNPRAAVEATVRVLKHPFRAGKLPVRGLFRMTCLLVGAASMANVRRIGRYRQTQTPGKAPGRPQGAGCGAMEDGDSLVSRLWHHVLSLLRAFAAAEPAKA
jgi:hypothetical protein